MKITKTYFCPDCQEVFERNKLTGTTCPSCTNKLTINLKAMITCLKKKDLTLGGMIYDSTK